MFHRNGGLRLQRGVAGGIALGLLAVWSAEACDGAPICIVKDPTGTPLNIREGPNGKILGTAKNGTKLEFIDHVEDKGKKWARVASFDYGTADMEYAEGFVFGAYLKCAEELPANGDGFEIQCTVNDPTGTPLNMRGQPNGEIYGSVRSGTVLRAFMTKTVNGKLWVNAFRVADDNVVGWVFDDYLKCDDGE